MVRKAHLLAIVTTALALSAPGCGKQGNEGRTDRSGSDSSANGAAAAPANDAAPAPGGPVSGHEPGAAVAGAGTLPAGHPPIEGSGGTAPPAEGSGQGKASLHWTVPESWVAEPPTNRMRHAQYRVPRAGGDPEEGECAVFYFGPTQGGTPESNASRWVSQFTQPDGSSSEGKAKIEMRKSGENEVMFVQVKGTYAGMGMPGMGGGEPKRGYALLGAIVTGPDAPWFFKFTGPDKTVEANRAAFEAMIASVHPGE